LQSKIDKVLDAVLKILDGGTPADSEIDIPLLNATSCFVSDKAKRLAQSESLEGDKKMKTRTNLLMLLPLILVSCAGEPTMVTTTTTTQALLTAGCNRNALTGSKLTLNNYNQVITGMSKAQVERIMGPPTTSETKDMLVFKKTSYRDEEGPEFALFTFKNDELDTKEGNLVALRSFLRSAF